ncbi:hypothetical protein SAMN05421547_101571 [Delftia lacustris]|uniref:Uncharacterized protein n=1 Tax=Delftia lacustris TaxID=558537 RepID=A0A1H3FA05_9BURK|nr:hypothetical protein SAMN05421547_101571 [Delftia lacustris]
MWQIIDDDIVHLCSARSALHRSHINEFRINTESNVFCHRSIHQINMLRHIANCLLPGFRIIFIDWNAVYAKCALLRMQQTQKNVHQRTFPYTARPDYSNRGVGFYRKTKIFQNTIT